MVAAVLFMVIAFLFHIQNETLPSRVAVQQRETLGRMMEENRREFPNADDIDIVEVYELMTRKNCALVDVRTEPERNGAYRSFPAQCQQPNSNARSVITPERLSSATVPLGIGAGSMPKPWNSGVYSFPLSTAA